MIAKTKHLQIKKGRGIHLPFRELPAPKYVYIPVDNTRSKLSELSVEEGQHVYIGTRLGQRHASFFDQPIFSSVSGTYVGKEKRLYRNNKVIEFLKIENDFKDEKDPACKGRSEEQMDQLNKEELAVLMKYFAGVGLGGSSFPNYIKLQTKAEIKMILVNGVECEPYMATDYLAIKEQSAEIIKGMKLLKRVFGCHDVRLCVKPIHPELKPIFEEELAKEPDSEVRFQFVKDYYPQGWEVAMIKEATGIEVLPGKLPMDYGVLDFNVSSVIQIYHAAKESLPIIDRYVCVQGDAIKDPCIVKARVGTPFTELIEAAGGYVESDKPKMLILGGPMMGATVSDDTGVTTRTVTSLIVDYVQEYEEAPCIRCGSCVLSCPVHLRPVDIMNAMKVMPVDKDRVKALTPLACMECGLCTYSCTSKIKILDYIRRAKIVAKL